MKRTIIPTLTVLSVLSVLALTLAACETKDAPASQPESVAPAAGNEGAEAEDPAAKSDDPAAGATCDAGEGCGEATATDKGECGGGGTCGAAATAKAGADPKREESCGAPVTELTNPAIKEVDTADGGKATHVGNDFAEAPVVKVSELLAKPDDYQGKVVQIEGDVSAMCRHKRGWFSIAAEDKSGDYVRVTTAPVFLVPAGSIGKQARAQGKVEVITVAAGHARHLAAEHKLGEPAEITADVKQVVLRASGAEFR